MWFNLGITDKMKSIRLIQIFVLSSINGRKRYTNNYLDAFFADFLFTNSCHHLKMLLLSHVPEDHSECIATHIGVRAIIHIMHIIIDATCCA